MLGSASDASASIGIELVDSAGNIIYDNHAVPDSTSWTQQTVAFTYPSGVAEAYLYVWKNAGTSYVYADDFNVTPQSASAPAATATATPTPTPTAPAQSTSTPTPSATGQTASPNGSAIPPQTQLIDSGGTVWTLVNGQIARNGTIDSITNGVILLLYYNGTIYQETFHTSNGVNLWWLWNGTGWVPTLNPISAFTSMFKVESSGLCLNVANASLSVGGGLEQYDCNGYISLTFAFKPATGILYTITSANSNLCVDYGSSSTAGNQVVQNTCVAGQGSQLWTVSQAPDGSYTIGTSDGKGCLGISGGSTASKAIAVTSACNGSTAQRFRTPVSSTSGGTSYTTTLIPPVSALCVNVASASTSAGAGVEQYTCTGASSEQFSLVPLGEGLYNAVSVNSGLCLQSGASSTAGTQVTQNPCSSGTASQEWMVEANSDGTFGLGTSDGLGCMEVQGASTAINTIVETSSCSDTSPGQRFQAAGI